MRLRAGGKPTIFVAALAAAALTFGIGAAAGAPPDDRPHAIDDSVVDTPAEAHGMRHGPAGPSIQQHGGLEGHLPGSVKDVELVGQLTLSNVEPGQISDVGTLGNFAYLGSYATQNCDKGGFYVVDITDRSKPTEVGFFPTAPGSFVSEGVQAISIRTPSFRGDILAINNEICAETGSQIGGFSLFDVTNPRNPQPLVQGFGDMDPGGVASAANQTHSVFVWQQGQRAFLAAVDDEELEDVDIFEITNPRHPVQIAEVGLADWPGAQNAQSEGIGTFAASFLHDMVVEQVHGNWIMLVSYWDAGYITLNVNDPANPVFINDSDFPDPDPLTGVSPPEGNGHQAEYNYNDRFILAADEDFSPFRLGGRITSGPFADERFDASQGDAVPQIDSDSPLVGPTIFFGRGCNGDPNPPAPNPHAIAVVERGVCTFDEKAANVAAAGYAAGIVFNNDAPGGDRCEALVNMAVEDEIPFIFVARSTGFMILGIEGYQPANCPGGPNPSLPAPGTPGEDVEVKAVFDGWGYVRLIDAATLTEIDEYAIPEALDPAFAQGFGDLSVHEVATDPSRDLAYVAWYAGGFRVLSFGPSGIQEVGRYIDANGNNFWGVEIAALKHKTERPDVLASDRDSGLWIFRYTGTG